MVFSYATTADLTQAVTGDKNKYINKIEVDGKKDEATYDYTYSKGEIVKTDAIIKRILLVQQQLVN